ncbi:NAD-dependent epimerase/dehydratase family protein [Helicobacter anatolicus]|uniref:NAD-dependent epimerase/dehydratase family protein n=1 Tax=Helicobacter anatolicus TaxID=2905874 RepID=UPI001E2E7632|nr:NAD-dependent epimerase/dehydratase family protein [Helicobacter anatolicus]MCE3040288.1 NAD-dependent epimerase/dehydratase family protein [Helicobacter anatolicus]
MNHIVNEDLNYIFESLNSTQKKKLQDSTILVTGCGGFLGFYLMHFFVQYAKTLNLKKIIGLDNFMFGKPKWLDLLIQDSSDILEINEFNIIKDNIATIPSAADANLIIHAASIASPSFYRAYPIETLDANVWGLRNLLEFYKNRGLKGFLFFSSSEIYGDPSLENIPTSEEYRGNVACIGPRACYDESKRFGETICYLFHQKYQMPITIARPFNNYGPGIGVNDKRVVADFAQAVTQNIDIKILSQGTPTRTFCYISDAISGYLKVLLHDRFDYFNIGIDKPEISITELSNIYVQQGKEIFGYTGKAIYDQSKEKDYLTHNPQRRCPNIQKAKKEVDYNPTILVYEGVGRYLRFLKEQYNEVR